jgi:aryl-alcohol dehydrogenase-like predicted oxidoreductase
MRYRHTRDKSLRVSEIGIGTYALTGVYGKKDPAEFKKVLRKAFDLGVTFFDVAPVYGNAEGVVGEVMNDVRTDIVISSKVAADLGSGLSCCFEHVADSCERSLKALGTDYIDLYQIHFDDGKTPTEEVIRAFDYLKSSGKILTYGIGHVSFERASEYVDKGNISTVMGELSAVSTMYYSKMLPLVRKAKAGYIGFSLTGRGLLTGAIAGRDGLSEGDIRRIDSLFAGEKLISGLRVRDRMRSVASEMGATPAQVAIRWALSRETVLTGLVGPSSVEHLTEDVKAADVDIPPSLQNQLDSFLAREEARLAGALKSEVTAIIRQRAPQADAISRMIYALEGLAELDLAPEAELIPHFRTLIKLRSGQSDDTITLEAIREDLLRFLDGE